VSMRASSSRVSSDPPEARFFVLVASSVVAILTILSLFNDGFLLNVVMFQVCVCVCVCVCDGVCVMV
jgi:hypothetical protein